GKMQGNMLLELSYKGKAYTQGYKSPFDKGEGNDPSTLLNDLQHAEHREFAPTCSDVGFRIPEDTDPRSKKPKQDDPDYAAKLMLHNAFCSERDAYGQDFFSYVQKHWKNLEEPWNASLVLAALDKQFRTMGIDELYTRPFDDIVVEEFISNLPGPTIAEVDEPMEQAGGSAEAAPADSPSGEMAGEAKQESDSGAPMETNAPEGSPSGEVSGVKVEEPERTWFPPTAAPDDVRMEEASESGDHEPGSSPSGEVPMPDMNFSAEASNNHDNLYEQGIWGKTKTRVEPGAYEAEAKATADAEEKNEQAFEQYAGEKEKEGLADTPDFMNFHEAYHLTERMSPL
ncbi:GIP, partial [Symbiodinium necroappetens]